MTTADLPAPSWAEPATTALRLTGGDTLPLLHRIGTQALLDLAPGGARATLFCDFRGRLLHRAVVAVTDDGAVWLLRHDAPGAALAAFVDRHVFRDDVKIEDHSAALWVEETGDAAAPLGIVEKTGVPERVVAGGGSAWIVRPAPGTPHGLEVLTNRERARILAGRPAHGREIAEAFNPFEVGLGAEVSLEKGCYTGQEALQRLITYESVRRELAHVSGEGPPPAVPAAVAAAGEPVGTLTSAVEDSPGRWIGLAVLKRGVAGGETEIEAAGARCAVQEIFTAGRPAGGRTG